MLFLFKKSEVVLDCFTDSSSNFELSKPNYAIKFIPDWWKQLPSYTMSPDNLPISTMKNCEGIIEHYKHGFIIPLWSDLFIEIGPKGSNFSRYIYADGVSTISEHSVSAQMNNFLDEKDAKHVKLTNPWCFSCKDNIQWHWSEPKWNNLKTNDWIVLPGMTSFKYQFYAHINMFLYRDNTQKTFNFKYGDPLVHVVPITDKKLVLRHHLVSEEEQIRIAAKFGKVKFVHNYKTIKKFMKGKTK